MSKHTPPLPNTPSKLPPVATRKAAAKVAGWIGCTGAHQIGQGWHPCDSPEELRVLIKKGKSGLRELQGQKKKEERTIYRHHRTKVDGGFVSPLRKPKRRTVRTDLHRDGWEPLTERGVLGIHTLPSGGLASAKVESEKRHDMIRYENATIPTVVETGERAPVDESLGKVVWRRGASLCEERLIALGNYSS